MIELLTDSYPVRLPLVTANKSHWSKVKEVISAICQPPHDLNSSLDRLCEAIHKLHALSNNSADKDVVGEKDCEALRKAVKDLFTAHPALFGDTVLPFIVQCSLELQRYTPWLPMMRTGVPCSTQLDRRLVLSLLANMLLCNNCASIDLITPEEQKKISEFNWHAPDWYQMYSCGELPVAVERIKCFLQYFISAAEEFRAVSTSFIVLPGSISVERCVGYIDGGAAAVSRCRDLFTDDDVHIHTLGMEDPSLNACGIVDFANRELHFGSLTPSATQDEVLFSVRTEMFGAMFVVEAMNEEDVLVISGAPQLCNTTGYSSSFRFCGPVDHALTVEQSCGPAVYMMDAVTDDHFTPAAVRRDVNKALLAFTHAKMHASSDESIIVSTGSWGCGAFGGDKLHKFLQQIIAAKTAGIKLAFSAFGNDEYARQLQGAFNVLVSKQIRVCDLWNILLRFKGFDNDSFHEYITSTLGISWSMD